MKTIKCSEARFECYYAVKGETEEDVMKNWEKHVKKAHGMKEEDLTRNETENKRTYLQFLTFLIRLNNLKTIVSPFSRSLVISYNYHIMY